MQASALAVLLGYLVSAALVMMTHFALTAAGGLPKEGEVRAPALLILLVLVAFDLAWSAAGGYVTSWRAPHRPLHHAFALGMLMELMAIVNLVTAWGHEPLWYQIAVILVALPGAMLGGLIRRAQESGSGH